MAAKKKIAEPAIKPRNQVTIYASQGDDVEALSAQVLTEPETQAARTIQQLNGNLDVDALAQELKSQTKKVADGNMQRAEAILLSQAQTLDSLFNHLAMKAHRQEYLSSFEINLRLALRAQAQSRATLETLSNIKNPPVVYAKQANISNGPQQVNNGVPTTRTNEDQNQPNELLTVNHGETLDSRAESKTIGSHPEMATLE